MTTSPKQLSEADVVEAFLRSCIDGNAEAVAEWRRRHPEHADAILEAAATLILAPPQELYEEPSEAVKAERRKRAFARAEALLAEEASNPTLRDLIADANMDLPKLADAINIDREPVAEIEAGRVELPVPQRLIASLSRVLRKSVSVIEAAIRYHHDHPRFGHASSEGSFAMERVTWRELIEDSDMSPERKAYWLGED